MPETTTRDPQELFEDDDAVETFRDLVNAIREKRYQAAVRPRRELKRRFGYDVMVLPEARKAVAS